MLRLKGETKADYFHLDCEACKTPVTLSKLRWEGGVPQVKVRCDKCGGEDDIKLHPSTWAQITPS